MLRQIFKVIFPAFIMLSCLFASKIASAKSNVKQISFHIGDHPYSV